MRSLISAIFLFVAFGSYAYAQQYDYLVERGKPTGTAAQYSQHLNDQSVAGWDFYQAFSDVNTGDAIAVYRRAHKSCPVGATTC